ncbi:hypothetical protein C4D60_Mb01t29430 [Musa balbisiana]|uniref:Major facilitator superfamily (MFS) profile domain-containing protein n=1 Tax=Musa balbisiana TaxID=52838 RepID=A0A4S8JRL7_MUSBA|nr:hypothetical protein C4D60_Mb01t29430 [Musa balbisiana]
MSHRHRDLGRRGDTDRNQVRDERTRRCIQAVCNLRGALHLRLRLSVCLILGATGLAGTERDLPLGDPVGGAEHHRVRQHVFLMMMCHMKFALFYFFGAWVLVMTIFVFFFVPETKNVPIDEMTEVWKRHWSWSKSIDDDDRDVEMAARS